jgi:putative restriction endonuclease
MSAPISPPRRNWTRDELVIVLNVYHKLPFGQFYSENPVVAALAAKFGRTRGSVAMKLSNFASLDPDLKQRGIKGLEGASNLDRQVWGEFHENPAANIAASEEALRDLFGADTDEEIEVSKQDGINKRKVSLSPPENTEVLATSLQRRGQNYFRDLILNNYGERCAISEINLRELLVASHILPWSKHPNERLNVRNGICLSRIHDAAFDRGLITFDEDLCLQLSTRLAKVIPKQVLLERSFGDYEGQPLRIPPEGVGPSQALLATHRATIFKR